MEDAVPWTTELFHTWKTTYATNASQNGPWQLTAYVMPVPA